MIIRVANPIYDSVFKYLMEDERIARTVLSALLKKEVVEVQIRRNEYTNGYRDNISMFRIDFGARIPRRRRDAATDSHRAAKDMAGNRDFAFPAVPRRTVCQSREYGARRDAPALWDSYGGSIYSRA